MEVWKYQKKTEAATLLRSLPMENGKGLAHEAVSTSDTDAGLIHDVTDKMVVLTAVFSRLPNVFVV